MRRYEAFFDEEDAAYYALRDRERACAEAGHPLGIAERLTDSYDKHGGDAAQEVKKEKVENELKKNI